MGCDECTQLAQQFSDALQRHAALCGKDLAALKAGDKTTVARIGHELTISTAEINNLKTQLLNHKASHHRIPTPENEGKSSQA